MAMSTSDEYTVVSGDNLWNISGQDAVYGNPYQWPLIYKANSDQIKDADLIYAGQVFSIPSASSGDIDAAVQHAKTRGAWSVGEVEQSDQDYLAR
jgi:LysM repeat protein